ncbi:MAG: MFS transporter [Pseudomonadota bacterium]
MTRSATHAGDGAVLSLWTKLAHGFGAAAYGAKNNGFDYFLLFFYANVIGLDPRLAGLSILIALLFDAFSDPLVGYVSDNWRSKWGRRHPFMYAAVIPVTFTYFLLWIPPDWSDGALFIYITLLAIAIRTFITFFETPSSALTAELTLDYDERTKLQAFRTYFGWTVGNLLTVIGFGILFVPTLEFADGRFNPDAYITYGILGSVVIFISILGSAMGTHSRIPHLQSPPPKRTLSVGRIFREMFETLSEPSFGALFAATLFAAVANGVSASLAFTRLSFFWEFSAGQIFIWTLFVFISAVLGAVIAPMAARRLGKKRAVIWLGIVAFSIAPAPILFRLLGLMPENGDPILFPLILTINTIDLGLIIALQAVSYAMIADLVEQSQVKTGRRSEGVFYAAVTFTRKATQGLGVLAGGFILAYAAFPENPRPGSVPEDALFRLGVGYVPVIYVLYAAMLIALCFYRIDRETHQENLRKIAETKGDATPAE